MLIERIKTAAILIALFSLVFFLGEVPLFVLGLVIFILINFEFYRMAGVKTLGGQYQHVAASCLIPIGYFMEGWSGFAGGILVALITIALLHIRELETSEHQPMISNSFPAAIAGLLYTGALGAMLPLSIVAVEEAEIILLLVIAVVIATDTFAYFGGRAFGKHKLSPRISPNKTIEGAAAGLLAAMGAAQLGLYFEVADWLSLAGWGLLGGLLAMLGDLVASLFKRIFDVKDTGSILPGHGGVLDRVDGLIFAVLILYFA